jgi:hypothetical protein
MPWSGWRRENAVVRLEKRECRGQAIKEDALITLEKR